MDGVRDKRYFPDEANGEETIDLVKIINQVISNWYWFVVFVFSAIIVAYYINHYSAPEYKVEASLIIKDNSDLGDGISQILTEMGAYNRLRKKKVQNEMGKLLSYSVANKTLRKLYDFRVSCYSIGRIRNIDRYKELPFKINVIDLDSVKSMVDKPIFVSLLDEGKLKITSDSIKSKIIAYGDTVIIDDLKFVMFKKESGRDDIKDYYFVVHDLNRLTNEYKKRLNVEQIDEKSSILKLSISLEVPKKAAKYLNTLMKTYISNELEKKNVRATNAIKFIDSQLKLISDSLDKISTELQQFRSRNKLVDISMKGSNIYKKLYELGSEKTHLQVKNKYYEYLLSYLKEKKDLNSIISPSVVGVNDRALEALISKLLDDFTQYQLIKYSSRKDNPSMKFAENNLEKTREALMENLTNLKLSTDIQLKEIEKKIEEVNKDLERLPYTEKQMINIQRYYDLNNDIYTYLLKKKSEAGISKASNVPEAEIIDYAIPENAVKVKPKTTLNYLIAIVLGLIVPFMFIMLRDYFNNRITDKSDIVSRTDVPIIGVIGHNQEKKDLIVYEKPKSSISETFRIIRTNVKYFSPDKEAVSKEIKVITINSTISGEGKTFIASNLAAIYAMANKKTALLGLDLRKPKLHKVFGVENDKGISDYLIGSISYDEMVVPTGVKNLYLFPSGTIPPNPVELIESKEMKQLIEKVKNEFDAVIIDTPPLALVADALIINKFADVSLFVVRQNYTTKQVIDFVDGLYHQGKIRSLAILVNDLKVKGYYGYNYKYGYSYRYSYGYGYGYGYYGYGGGYYDDDSTTLGKNRLGVFDKLFRKKS